MDSLLSILLLLVAAIVAMLTYMYVQAIPVIALTSASAIALAAGVWWHWTQFSGDYTTSTWQQILRNYASYVMVLVVLLLSYGFYVMASSGSTLQIYVSSTANTIRNTAYTVSSTIASGTSKVATNLVSENRNVGSNRNRSANLLV